MKLRRSGTKTSLKGGGLMTSAGGGMKLARSASSNICGLSGGVLVFIDLRYVLF